MKLFMIVFNLFRWKAAAKSDATESDLKRFVYGMIYVKSALSGI